MYAIETMNLTKKYKNKIAVDNLNLKIEENTIFALLGTNGAGKTTTLKMLTTLLLPTSGTVKILGLNIEDDSYKIKELINISPQETAIAPNLTVYENLEFMAGVYNIKNRKEKIEELIKLFNLTDVLKEKSKNLSGGYQRKLSIALALINEPKILFLDEPTLGLDVLSKRDLWDIIKNLKNKTTIILTTHYMEEAQNLSDNIGIMSKGKLIELGTSISLIKKAGAKTFEDAFVKLITEGDKSDND